MENNTYPPKDREEVIRKSKEIENQMRTVNLGFAYNMYDIMRLQLEELNRIGNTMELIFKAINQEQ